MLQHHDDDPIPTLVPARPAQPDARSARALAPWVATLLLLGPGCGSSGPGTPPAPPEALAYSNSGLSFRTGAQIPHLVPSVEGGAADSFTIAPPLPAGLGLNPQTGVVSGVPTEALPETAFTVTASNAAGEASAEVLLAVVEKEEVVHPRFLYASNWSDHSISVFVVDAETGELRHDGYVGADLNPASVVVAPGGHFLYAANAGAGTISVYRLDPTSGQPSIVAHEPVGIGVYDLALDPTGTWLFATNSAGTTVADLDPEGVAETGAVHSFRVLGDGRLELAATVAASGALEVAAHPSGAYVYTTNLGAGEIGVYGVDASTGALERLQTAPAGEEPAGLALTPAGGALFVANHGSNDVTAFAVDGASGLLSPLATLPAGQAPVDVEVSPDGAQLFVAGLQSREVLRFDVDAAGVPSFAESLPFDQQPFHLALFPVPAEGGGVDDQLYVSHLETSDVSRALAEPGSLSVVDRIRSRGAVTDLAFGLGTTPLAFEPTLAFSANASFGDVSTLVVDPATGRLTDLGTPVASGSSPLALALDPRGAFLYAANGDSGDVSQFSIDHAQKTLLGVADPVSAGSQVRALAVEPTGRFAFAAGADGLASFSIDGATGALAALEQHAVGGDPAGVACDPAGLYLYVLNRGTRDVTAFWIHGVTGRLTELDGSPFPLPSTADATSLAFHPGGRFLYVSDEAESGISRFRVAADGSLSELELGKVVQEPRHVALTPDGDWLFATSFERSEITLARVDALDGTLETAAVEDVGAGPSSVHVEASGRFAYVAGTLSDQIGVFSFDAELGALLQVESFALAPGSAPTAVLTDSRLVGVAP